MTKHSFWCGAAIIAVTIGAIPLLPATIAAGTYRLEYPAGYGCKCVPNWQNYGHFETQWREWPGEQRLDKTHPKAIGAEGMPRTKGYVQPPLPRTKLQDLQQKPPEAEQPTPGEQPENPITPGTGPLPGLPTEPGGITPSPGLPPDLNIPDILKKTTPPGELPKDTPPPLEKKETPPLEPPKELKMDGNPGTGSLQFKSESPKNGISSQPSLIAIAETEELDKAAPTRLPKMAKAELRIRNAPTLEKTSLQVKEHSELQPVDYPESFRSGTIYPAREIASQTDYQAPADSSGNGWKSHEAVQQSYQQPQPKSRESVAATSTESRQIAAPVIALNGFCPVELCRGGRWVQGDPRWTVIHQGLTYRLAGNDQRLQFLADPERFAPANGGNDLVLSVKEGRTMHGELNYCAAFQGRLYMFSSAETQAEFQKNPERYLGQQKQKADGPGQAASTAGLHEFQTLGRSYNHQREGF
jgi:YHS domain-containing protein